MAKPKILVVEDEAIVAKDIQMSLKKLGYNVTNIVSSGDKALKEVEENPPDLVLMDIIIKGDMDGIETATKIQRDYHIPVIFLTANADEKTVDKAKHAESYGYIIKPFREKELQTTIEMALYKSEKDNQIRKERDYYYAIVENKEITDSIYIRSDLRLNKIKFDEIYYVEALKEYVVIHTLDNNYTTHCTIKEIMNYLPPDKFVRIHRSFIVNINKIFSIKFPDLVIEDKKKILPIGGLYKKELYEKLNLI